MKDIYIRRITSAILLLVMAASVFVMPQSSYGNDKLKLKAKSAILVDAGTGEVLYEKNPDQKLAPASMTKMMTAILVVENLDMDDIVTVSKYVTTIDGSALGLKKGEKITVEDLFNVMLVYSANDCAVALAEAVSGSVEEFSELMNKRAKELGCTGSNFLNPNGLNVKGHYSTAQDMAKIARKAMEYEEIRNAVKQTTYQTHKTNKRKVLTVGTTDRLLFDTYSWINVNGRSTHPYYKYAVGIKTGYTPQAGGCLAAKAVKGKEEYISIVIKSTAFDRFADTIELLEYGFDNFDSYMAVEEDYSEIAPVKKGKKNNVEAGAKNGISTCISCEEDKDKIKSVIAWEENKAPIAEGQKVGTITVMKDEKEIGKTDLIAMESVEKSMVKTIITSPLLYAVLILVSVFIVTAMRKRRKRGAGK